MERERKMSTLPNFPGAAVVYARAEAIATKLNADEYRKQREGNKNKRFRFSPNAEAAFIIDAMNRGDEEALKAANHQYRHLAVARYA